MEETTQEQEWNAVDQALAGLVTFLIARKGAEVVGLPPWVGGAVAAVGIAAASDERANPDLRRFGLAITRPGTVLVSTLKRHSSTIMDRIPTAAPPAADDDDDVIDIPPSKFPE